MKTPYLLFLLAAVLFSSCSEKIVPGITVEELDNHVRFLASDELRGRYPGTPGDSVMNEYLMQYYMAAGLKGVEGLYRQDFEILTGVFPSEQNIFLVEEYNALQGEDFYPFSFSGNGSLEAEVVFCGYGYDFSSGDVSRNDYEGLDVEGKWVLILRGEPADGQEYLSRGKDRMKAKLAMEKGAAGVLLVSGKEFSARDNLDKGIQHIPSVYIPAVQVTRELANRILSPSGHDIIQLEESLRNEENPGPKTLAVVKASLKLQKDYATTSNIFAMVPGTGESGEWIVTGAHHDHLGMGGEGSSSRKPDTIAVHNGADDNASGVAAVLELAEYFASELYSPKRNLLFISFGAEEKGLLGSRYFVENPPFPVEDMLAMINLDMIGRMKADSSLEIGGLGTTDQSRDIIEEVNAAYGLNLKLSDEGFGPSDHSSFYSKDVPVFFLSTGPHSDYHTPFDDADSLNMEGMLLATRFVRDLIVSLDTLSHRPEFRETRRESQQTRRYRGRVTMGIMPDVSGSDSKGLKILGVSSGKPAEKAGLKEGDIIISIDGKTIENIYDYMYLLNDFEPGQKVEVVLLRNDEKIRLNVIL